MTPTPQLALVLRNGLLLMLFLAAVNRVGLPEGLFLALAILVVLEADLGGGVIAGRERMVGSLMGLLSVVITSGVSALIPLPARLFGGLLMVRLFSFSAGLSSGYIVGGHVVAGSLLHHPNDWWYYAFWRTMMTILGVFIGVLLSRHVYSQRTVSAWRLRCDRWIQDLAEGLTDLTKRPDHERHYLELRERRNALRRGLPQMIAEQGVTRTRWDTVQWAQQILHHGSSVMSCCRDLSLLLRRDQQLPPELTTTIHDLQTVGQQRLHQLCSGTLPQGSDTTLEALQQRLQRAVETSLLQPEAETARDASLDSTIDSRQRHLLASRLLLLSDALGQLPTSWGLPCAEIADRY